MSRQAAPSYDQLVFELSSPGRIGFSLPECDVPVADPRAFLPASALRAEPPDLPEVSEFDVVRHYSRLSRLNYGLDTHFYPLGSCTMKYNPRLNEDMARLPGFARLHPLAPETAAQGALALMHALGEALAEIAGMDAVSLQPAAGAQGELAGIFMIRALSPRPRRAAHARSSCRTPRTGPTRRPPPSPATRWSRSSPRRTARSTSRTSPGTSTTDVAAFMITVPNTLGMFEPRVVEITELCHAKGVQVYMDGANLNAILGITRPGDLGFDVCHFNLHKTFTTPHGGGGPGAGPVGVKAHLEPFLPVPGGGAAGRALRPRLAPPEVHRQAPGVLGELRDAGAGLHVHPHHGGGRAARRLRERRPQRQLRPQAPGGPLRRGGAGAVHARVRALGPPPEEAGRDAPWTSPSACSISASTPPRRTFR